MDIQNTQLIEKVMTLHELAPFAIIFAFCFILLITAIVVNPGHKKK